MLSLHLMIILVAWLFCTINEAQRGLCNVLSEKGKFSTKRSSGRKHRREGNSRRNCGFPQGPADPPEMMFLRRK